MCVFLISPVTIAEPLTSELIDTPVFHNLAQRPIKYQVSVPIPIVSFTHPHVILNLYDWLQQNTKDDILKNISDKKMCTDRKYNGSQGEPKCCIP